jgi:hypothetical protein
MKITTALAILCKAYLKFANLKTYDLRCFEFWNGNKCFTKLKPLLLSVQFAELTEAEEEAKQVLINSKLEILEQDINFLLELLKH